MAWEAWTNLTLQNGWSGTLQYTKNKLGIVILRGDITPGTKDFNTIIATLPAGYIPLSFVNVSAVTANGDAVQGITITNNGGIRVYRPASSDGALSIVTAINSIYFASL